MGSCRFAVVASLWLTAAIYAAASSEDDHEDPYKKLESASKRMRASQPYNSSISFKPTVGTNMSCKVVRSSIPTSVHRLRPADIKVVGAMGDSISAAFGARSESLITISMEFRGMSWSIGGDSHVEKAATLPNALKHFNPDITGFATGIGKQSSRRSHLDVAVTGAIAQDMPKQAREIIKRMRRDPSIDFESDWKVITFWIGGNDLCRGCLGSRVHSVESFIGYTREALDILHAEVPRLFVNLVTAIDVTKLRIVRTQVCDVLHAFSCPCGTVLPSKMRRIAQNLARGYQAATLDLVASGRYDTRKDFTVVAQRFFEDIEVPFVNGTVDKTFFAPDCFHFSTRGHAAAAVALWNSMLAPVGKKPLAWFLGEDMKCPSKTRPFFATSKNTVNGHTSGKASNKKRRQKSGSKARTHSTHHDNKRKRVKQSKVRSHQPRRVTRSKPQSEV